MQVLSGAFFEAAGDGDHVLKRETRLATPDFLDTFSTTDGIYTAVAWDGSSRYENGH